MTTYELTYIVSPETTSEEVEAKGKEIESLIQSKEGVILKQSNPVAKTLSYPIKKRASGFLGFVEFQAEPEKLVEIKAIVEKDKKIVRHMFIIKLAAEFKKARRTRTKVAGSEVKSSQPTFEIERKTAPVVEEQPASPKALTKEKVELKDIEEQLEEILS